MPLVPRSLSGNSAFSPNAFDHAMDAADFNDDDPDATGVMCGCRNGPKS